MAGMQGAKFKGTLALFGAALFWGMAFAAQTAGSEHVGSFTFIAGKSTVACMFLALLILGRRLMGRGGTSRREMEGKRPSYRRVIIGGVICGLVLCAADNFQQAGITAYPPEAAASGRAGFLTATYVVMVALFARFTGRKLHPAVVVAVFVCLAGMYLLCVPIGVGFSGIYLGDGIMLVGALFYAFHILAVGRFSTEDALWLSCIQFAVSAAISAVVAVAVEHPAPADLLPALLPIVYVGMFSTGLGYTLQTIGQKHVDAAPAAIIMSLESVFAALSGWLMLGETLSSAEFFGCVLVFAAVLLAQWPELRGASRRRVSPRT